MTVKELQDILERAAGRAPDSLEQAEEDRRALLELLREVAWQNILPAEIREVEWGPIGNGPLGEKEE